MSPVQRSRTSADTSSPLRRRSAIETRVQSPARSYGTSQSSGQLRSSEPYARVTAKVRRAANVLAADDGLSLPAVSVNDLERAVSTFLDEVRLGLPVADTSSSRTSGSGRRSYGSKLQLELKDPGRAQRVRENRAAFRNDQKAIMDQRKRR